MHVSHFHLIRRLEVTSVYRLILLLAVLSFATSAIAAETPATITSTSKPEQKACEVWGQIAGSPRILQEGLTIELADLDGKLKQKTRVSANGNFDFNSTLQPGSYQFRVTTLSGVQVLEQAKVISGTSGFVFFVVRDPMKELAAANTVSFSALQHKTPQRAWNALRDAQKAAASGTTEAFIEHLQEAIRIDPDFAEAHSDLAAIYAQTGRMEEAMQHADTALRLNPQLPAAGCNFALLLVTLKRYEEAEAVARRMLNGTFYVSELQAALAISLIGQHKDINEAFEHLKQAVTEFPFVRLLAARVLNETGRSDLAVVQVKEYLRTAAHDCERADLEAWVASAQTPVALHQ
jgi:Tfp pilus assembly protein PilF